MLTMTTPLKTYVACLNVSTVQAFGVYGRPCQCFTITRLYYSYIVNRYFDLPPY